MNEKELDNLDWIARHADATPDELRTALQRVLPLARNSVTRSLEAADRERELAAVTQALAASRAEVARLSVPPTAPPPHVCDAEKEVKSLRMNVEIINRLRLDDPRVPIGVQMEERFGRLKETLRRVSWMPNKDDAYTNLRTARERLTELVEFVDEIAPRRIIERRRPVVATRRARR